MSRSRIQELLRVDIDEEGDYTPFDNEEIKKAELRKKKWKKGKKSKSKRRKVKSVCGVIGLPNCLPEFLKN